jgi:hypothetical protein
MTSDNERRAGNALGVCFISLGFLFETVVAHHIHPSPLSPIVWSVLGLTAVASLFGWWYFNRAAKGDRR